MGTDKLKRDRIARRDGIRDAGVDPYGMPFRNTTACIDVAGKLGREGDGTSIRVAGRILGYRRQGKSAFVDLWDRTGRIQIYVQRDRIGATHYAVFKLLQPGDIIGAEGEIGHTRTGELTIFADGIVVLSKALQAPPEKWHGLKDHEIRYRKRHLDLFANPSVRNVFLLRSRVIQWIRDFLNERGFVEVETPMMHPLAGGAAARPFITHHNTLDMDLYLRIAPELYLKRLLVGGLERVYEINRNFRNEGLSTKHNPEFTMIELYWAYVDYHDNMDLIEALLGAMIQQLCGATTLPFGDLAIDFRRPWPRKTYAELLREHAAVAIDDHAGVMNAARRIGMDVHGLDHWALVDEVFSETVEPRLIHPTFVLDYPAHMCPLARRHTHKPDFTERFELFIAGMEIANAYSELNDPAEQLQRFQEQHAHQADGEIDYDYVDALEYGMPPASGLGMGIDRLMMVLADTQNIRDVILFPLLRPDTGHGRPL